MPCYRLCLCEHNRGSYEAISDDIHVTQEHRWALGRGPVYCPEKARLSGGVWSPDDKKFYLCVSRNAAPPIRKRKARRHGPRTYLTDSKSFQARRKIKAHQKAVRKAQMSILDRDPEVTDEDPIDALSDDDRVLL